MTTLGNQSQPGGNFIHWPPNGVYERGNLSFRTKAFYSARSVEISFKLKCSLGPRLRLKACRVLTRFSYSSGINRCFNVNVLRLQKR